MVLEDRANSWNKLLYDSASSDICGVSIHPYLHLGDDFAGGGPLQPGVLPRTHGAGPTGWSTNATVQQLFIDQVCNALVRPHYRFHFELKARRD